MLHLASAALITASRYAEVNDVSAGHDGGSPGRTPPTPSTLDPSHAPLADRLPVRAAYGQPLLPHQRDHKHHDGDEHRPPSSHERTSDSVATGGRLRSPSGKPCSPGIASIQAQV